MKTRIELEKQLKALGFRSLGQSNRKGYTAWYGNGVRISVPTDDLITDELFAYVLKQAKGVQ